MAELDPRAIQAALGAPFAPEDLEWRLQTALKDKLRGLAVPYVTNRAIQSRLDDVVGPENWRNEYQPWHGNGKKAAQICGISLYFEGRGWITKWDGAEDSDIEPIKGGLSDSMKRAAVQWGIGRVLYNLDTVWVDIEARGNSFIIRDSERAKLNRAYVGMLDALHLHPAPPTGAQAQLTPTPPKNKGNGGEAASNPPRAETNTASLRAQGRASRQPKGARIRLYSAARYRTAGYEQYQHLTDINQRLRKEKAGVRPRRTGRSRPRRHAAERKTHPAPAGYRGVLLAGEL